MIAIARGSITEPDRLGLFIDDDMRAVAQLKAEGVMRALYRRAAGPGVVIVLEGESLDAMKERNNTLAFVLERLMTLEYKSAPCFARIRRLSCPPGRLGVPLTFTSVSQKQRNRWLGPNVGPERLFGTARVPASRGRPSMAWSSAAGRHR